MPSLPSAVYTSLVSGLLGNRSRPALRARLEVETEGNPLLSAGFALALLCRDERAPHDLEAFREARASTSPVLRAVGALAGIVFGDQEIEGLADLAVRMTEPFSVGPYGVYADAPADLPWGSGYLQHALAALAIGTGRGGDLVIAMLRALEVDSNVHTWAAAARLAIDVGGFKTRWMQGDIALPEDLSETQRTIALEFTRREINGIGWGLPSLLRDRQRWLGLTSEGALEKRVTAETPAGKRQWPIWKAWSTLAMPHVLDWPKPILQALSADETLEAYGEACGFSYRLIATRHGGVKIEPVLDVLPRVTDRSIEWAVAYYREVLAQWADKANTGVGPSPRLEGVYLAFIARGKPVPPELFAFFPGSAGESPQARAVLARLGTQAEEVFWTWLSQISTDSFRVRAAIPLIDLAPSKRVAERLVGALRSAKTAKSLGSGVFESALAKLKSVAVTEPVVAEALAEAGLG